MILTPWQSEVAKDTHRFRVLNCGRRSGKTILACEEMLGVAIAKKDRHVSYFAPTREDARDIMWEILVKRASPIISYKNDSRLEIKVKTQDGGESLIVLYGWESVQERGKGRGMSNDLIVLDEVSNMRNFWVGWDEVLSPTLIDRIGSALFISTPKGYNHFYDLYNLHEKISDYKSFHFTSYDNPHIPRSEIDREKLAKGEDVFAQEYLADFRKTQGLVYKEFIRKKHVYTDTVFNPVERLVGIDWGFTNPAAIYLIERDTDNKYYVSKEYYKTGKTTPELIEHISTLNGNKFYPDPAEPDRNEEMRRAGFIPRAVSKDVEAGINAVRELLNTNRLFIHSSCVNLISEFETYSYPDKKPDHNENEAPIKENDHALDSIRYVLYMQPMSAQQTAHVHYPSSALPTQNIPQTQRPKMAYVFHPKL
jgi:PBSX family phage terminase large subunit